MGKIAAVKLCYGIGHIMAISIALISILGALMAGCDPRLCDLILLIELTLPALLVFNIVYGIVLVIRRRPIALLFIAAVLFNFNYFGSIVQNPYRDTALSTDANAGTLLRVMSFNAEGFDFVDNAEKTEKFRKLLEQYKVDIVCIQEYENRKDMETKLRCFQQYPYYFISGNQKMRIKTAIFSKYPITDTCQILFDRSENTALRSEINVNNRRIRVFSNHFQTTNFNTNKKKILQMGIDNNVQTLYNAITQLKLNCQIRADQADLIRSMVTSDSLPTLLCSDLNDTPASYAYHKLKGDLSDGFITHGKGYGYTYKGLLRLFRIDYIFYSKHLQGIDYISPCGDWSDHKPVIMTLRLL